MAKSKRQYTKITASVTEFRPPCPGCGEYKKGKSIGTRDGPNLPFDPHGQHLGMWVKTRTVRCQCGQVYIVKIIEIPTPTNAKKEPQQTEEKKIPL